MATLSDRGGRTSRTLSKPKAGTPGPKAGPLSPPAPVRSLGKSTSAGVAQSTGATAPRSFTSPTQRSSGSGYDGGGGGAGSYSFGGGGGMMDAGMAPVVTAPTEEDYLAGDAGYQTELSALQSALQRFLADADFQRGNYQTDYNQSLRDLGYDEGSKQWNWNDKLTASGRGYQNQLDDFGARGMLQSSGYADAFNELQRLLGQQYDSLSGARTNFMTDLDNQTANFRGENTANQQAARAEALQRRAAQYAL